MRLTGMAVAVWMSALAMTAAQTTAQQTTEKPSAAYQKAMKDVNAANMSVRAAVTAKDYDTIAKDAGTLKAAFQVTLDFWTAKKAEDAIGFAKNALKAATDLETAAKAKDEAEVTATARAVAGSCQACHMAHRQRMPDGTYEIK